MAVSDMGALAPETRAVVEAYLSRVTLLCGTDPYTQDALEDVRLHVLEAMDANGSAADASAVLEEFGAPEEFASRLRSETPSSRAAVGGDSHGAGTLFGVPYDMRMPTVERVRSRWWNPSDPRIWMPRAFGIGWDLNFGALAVALNLIRPDDEDEPFASVPEPMVYAALAVPVVLTTSIVIAWALMADSLPAELPVHWDVTGTADRFAPAFEALAFPLMMALIPTLWAAWTFVTRRSKASRVLSSSFASMLAALSAGIVAVTLMWTAGQSFPWLLPALIVVAVAVPFVMLVILARVNRREEWSKDLGAGAR